MSSPPTGSNCTGTHHWRKNCYIAARRSSTPTQDSSTNPLADPLPNKRHTYPHRSCSPDFTAHTPRMLLLVSYLPTIHESDSDSDLPQPSQAPPPLKGTPPTSKPAPRPWSPSLELQRKLKHLCDRAQRLAEDDMSLGADFDKTHLGMSERYSV